MFDIKDATQRAAADDLRLPFCYWVVFPFIKRAQWVERFGDEAFRPNEFLFADDLGPALLAGRLGASDRRWGSDPIQLCPLDQLQCVWHAFGDTSVLYCTQAERDQRRTREGTLGERFDEAAQAYKELSDEQQRLSEMNWEGGPRLVRGVAGSGKTIVLANNLARRLARAHAAAEEEMFPQHPHPRVLAVCFNRCLAPFIRRKIEAAYQQRTGKELAEGAVEVRSLNALAYQLANLGLWDYQTVRNPADMARALNYYSGTLEHLVHRDPHRLQRLAYDAIYVDEGQDFGEEEFRLLRQLCRTDGDSEPNLYVFYDDAQNLFGRGRPNWQSLGINVRGGRSHVMSQCFRNTHQIVEASFNVLYGTCAGEKTSVPNKEYGDIAALEQKELIHNHGGFWRVRFSPRDGETPRFTRADCREDEDRLVVARLGWLLCEQDVRPEDVMVLALSRQRVHQLADAITAGHLPGVADVHVPLDEKDLALCAKDRLTVSTVASAKGYDAYCVLMASANEFSTDVMGRASFYVGCTRAMEYLEVLAHQSRGLAEEFKAVLTRLQR